MAHPRTGLPRRGELVAAFLTLAVATAGGLAFYAVSAPAAFLTGSGLAVAAAVLTRLPTALPNPVRNAGFAVLGAMMGAGVTPDALADLAGLPLAVAGLVVVLVGATAASYVVLRRLGGFSRIDAFLGSVPGHFTLVMILSVSRGARVERVVIPQVLRLFILIVFIPFFLGGPETATLRVTTPADYGILEVAVSVAVAVASAMAANLLRVPAGMLMGPLVVSAVLSGTGLWTVAVPEWLGAACFIVLGAAIGVRLGAVQAGGFGRLLAASTASFVAAFAVAMGASVAVAAALGVPVGAIFLGYAPGGLDAMIALSFLLGYDVALVALLHTARMVLLGFSTPMLLPFFEREGAKDARGPGVAE